VPADGFDVDSAERLWKIRRHRDVDRRSAPVLLDGSALATRIHGTADDIKESKAAVPR